MKRYLPHLLLSCRLALGAIFVYAGLLKALDVTSFAGSIVNYQLLPELLNYLAAATLPYIEMLAGSLLLIRRHVRGAALLLGGLTGVFMIALASVLIRGLDIDCGCFGVAAPTSAVTALWRNAGLLLLAAGAFVDGGRRSA